MSGRQAKALGYDFTNLTPTQQELLTFGGWTVGSVKPHTQPSRATVQKLLDRGLIIRQEYRDGMLTVDEYIVPIPVHAEWCKHCSANQRAKRGRG